MSDRQRILYIIRDDARRPIGVVARMSLQSALSPKPWFWRTLDYRAGGRTMTRTQAIDSLVAAVQRLRDAEEGGEDVTAVRSIPLGSVSAGAST